MLDLQEDWASVGGGAIGQVESSTLYDWMNAPLINFPAVAQALAILLPTRLIVLAVLVRVGIFPYSWPWAIALPIVLEAALTVSLLKKTRLTAANIVLPSFELVVIGPLLDRLE